MDKSKSCGNHTHITHVLFFKHKLKFAQIEVFSVCCLSGFAVIHLLWKQNTVEDLSNPVLREISWFELRGVDCFLLLSRGQKNITWPRWAESLVWCSPLGIRVSSLSLFCRKKTKEGSLRTNNCLGWLFSSCANWWFCFCATCLGKYVQLCTHAFCTRTNGHFAWRLRFCSREETFPTLVTGNKWRFGSILSVVSSETSKNRSLSERRTEGHTSKYLLRSSDFRWVEKSTVSYLLRIK